MILSCDENNIELQKLNLPYLFVSIENHIKLDIVSQFTSTIRNTTLFDESTDVLIYFGSLYITYTLLATGCVLCKEVWVHVLTMLKFIKKSNVHFVNDMCTGYMMAIIETIFNLTHSENRH